MISAPLKALLDAIGKHEAPKGYGQIYSGAKGVPKDADVSKLTLSGVLAFQQRMLDAKSASTACGRYQFLRKTLKATIEQMGLDTALLWTPELQDRMAVHLMEGRGLKEYLAGQIGANQFCNNLAKEWASLPVVTAIKGAHRVVMRGETFYAGDKLNKAFHKPEAIQALVKALKAPEKPVQPIPHTPAPMAPRVAPSQPVPRLEATRIVAPQEAQIRRSFWDWLKRA